MPGGNGSKPATDARAERLRRGDWTGFTQVDNIVLYCPGLTDGEKVVYSILMSFDWPDAEGQRKGRVYPGVATIASLVGKSERQTQRIIGCLERKGLIRTRREGPLSATRYIVPVDKVDWRSLYGSRQSRARPQQRPDIRDTPGVTSMTGLGVTNMTPKEDEGEEDEEEQYEDRGLLQDAVIDFEDTSGELVAVGGAVRSEDGETAAGDGATGVVTVPQDGSSDLPERPETIPVAVWEALVRDYGQAAWVGASVYEARQSGRSLPLRDDFLNVWDGKLERSGVYELRD